MDILSGLLSGLGGGIGGAMGGGGKAEQAALIQQKKQDEEAAKTIMVEIEADKRKQQAQRYKITQDVKTKTLEIMQDSVAYSQKTASKGCDLMSAALRA